MSENMSENKTKASPFKNGRKKLLNMVFGRTAVVIILLLIQFILLFMVFAGFEQRLTVAYGGVSAVAFIMAIYIAGTDSNPAIKLSWTILMILMPVFGSLLYIFIHTELGHRILNKRLSAVLNKTKDMIPQNTDIAKEALCEDRWLYNLSHYTLKSGSYPIYRNRHCEYYSPGEEMFEALKTELAKAEKFIFLEFFIIEEGEMWDSILEILKEKAQNGVDVRVLYDGTCSVSLLPSKYPKELAVFGIKCKVFSPLLPFISTHYNNRDHRKIVVIDGKTAFTGGVNLADEYINRKNRFGHWKDSGIMLKGEGVDSFTLMFLQMWNVYGKNEDFKKYLLQYDNDASAHDGYIIPFGDSPLDNERVSENIYLDIINTAKKYVYIFSPYLILDAEMITALQTASKRGVDVRIVIPKTPDHKIAFAIAKSHLSDLVPYGVRVYHYTPGFIHSKVMVSDGTKAVVGTANLDYRSLYLHFECSAFIYGSSVIKDIEADALSTFGKSKEVLCSDIKRRGILSSIYNGILRVIAPLM